MHDEQLHHGAGHSSFSAYIRARAHWNIGHRQAMAMAWVAVSRFARTVPAGTTAPTSERQCRPIAGCSDAVKVQVWQRACVPPVSETHGPDRQARTHAGACIMRDG